MSEERPTPNPELAIKIDENCGFCLVGDGEAGSDRQIVLLRAAKLKNQENQDLMDI